MSDKKNPSNRAKPDTAGTSNEFSQRQINYKRELTISRDRPVPPPKPKHDRLKDE